MSLQVLKKKWPWSYQRREGVSHRAWYVTNGLTNVERECLGELEIVNMELIDIKLWLRKASNKENFGYE